MNNLSDSTNWKHYYERTKNRGPRPLLVKALDFVQTKNSALDLGAGALNDTIYLLDRGFNIVTAVDKFPVAEEIGSTLPQNKFNYVISEFEHFNFPKDVYDIVNAQYSLPFVSKSNFVKVFKGAISSLKSQGIFTGQLFGINDSWNEGKKDMTFMDADAVKSLITSTELIHFEEVEKDGVTASGENKHWHVFNVIFKK